MKRETVRKHITGMACAAAVLCCAGTALGGIVPLPVQKPSLADKVAVRAPVADVVLPARKPGADAPRAAELPVPAPKPAAFAKKPPLVAWLYSRFTESRQMPEEDAARYAHIFAFQDSGEFERADEEIAKLEDARLMGHVLYQRYMAPGYASSYAELAQWLDLYADHPGARRIYDLALRRKPEGEKPPRQPGKPAYVSGGVQDFDVGRLGRPYLSSRHFGAREKEVIRAIRRRVGDGPTSALRALEAAGGLFDPTAYDALQAQVAQSYFFHRKYDKAFALAVKSADRSGADVPAAGWIAGLSAWKAGNYAVSAKYFAQAARSPRASAWMSAAAGYWAARAHLRAHNPREVSKWLSHAARYPRTFYGIIALRALGLEHDEFNWEVPALNDKRIRALSRVPAGRRAMALAAAGRADLAAEELRHVAPRDNTVLQEALIAFSAKAGLPDIALRMGSAFKNKDGLHYDAALYPDAPWRPEAGFDIDRALVYAFIRQESRFDAAATNRSTGAAGVMQLMPATAQHVARLSGDTVSREDLSDPVVNVTLGQKYIDRLLENEVVDGNLFKLAVAYNAGPGKLARWEREVPYADDPLLFIESIPVAETRMFVERVMTNLWIYRIKYGQKTESLDSVAEGRWPVYTAQDVRRGLSFADAATFFTR